uniref:Helicase ATP-binding domain-containing protein n=1 Tax=viral metagenome TaxID=1070528 RepID=A0A6C0LXL2_9ZZZZ
MSFSYPLSRLSAKDKEVIKKLCQAHAKPTQYVPKPPTTFTFDVHRDTGEITLPIRMFMHIGLDDLPTRTFRPIDGEFTASLFTESSDSRHRDQDVVARAALDMLRRNHSCLLSLFTGFGKSITAIKIACDLGLKTLVLCKQKELCAQWKDEIERFTSLSVQTLVKGSKNLELDASADIYICGIVKAINAHAHNPNIFNSVGTLIVDECHNIMATEFSKALMCFHPKYLIGLSATPDRADGLDKLFVPFFGKRSDYIVREEVKVFTVVKYLTGFVPDIRQNYKGMLDWTNVIGSLATNPQRQRLIADIAHSYPNECIAIISKRKEELHGVAQILTDTYHEHVEFFIESMKKADLSSDFRILLTTRQKAGEGFNDMRLTMLILTTDSKDVRQNEGRVRNDQNVVVDLVDAFPTFEKHWELRAKWYRKRGATIITKGAKLEDAEHDRKRMLPPNL